MTPSTGLLPPTDYILMDEPAHLLYEINKPAPDSKSVHRYRFVQVIRGEGIAEYVEDLGRADSFRREQFCIPGGAVDQTTGRFISEHTVGELIDIAEYLWARPYDQGDIVRTDLVNGYYDHMDQIQRAMTGRRTFGPVKFSNVNGGGK